jgi:tetratricopeptide (TPR) repeat protein
VGTFSISEAFRGAQPPAPWFHVLETNPVLAASQLLFGTGDFSTYQAAEPVPLALQWLREVHDSSLPRALDLALAGWVERFWGEPVHPDSAGSASLTAEAWQNLGLILSAYPEFQNSAAALRDRVLAERNFLLAIGEGPTSDPAGRALQAVSRYQKDLTLKGYWWELAALPPNAPWFHGEYAIDGLCHLPFDGTGIPDWVPSGLRRLASGLALRVGDGWLDAKLARRYFLRVAQLTHRRFPFEERWRLFWLSVYRSARDEQVQAWLQSLCSFSDEERRSTGITDRALRPKPAWTNRARDIARALTYNEPDALQAAYYLLAEQQEYLNRTGDANFFVRSACNFAKHVQDRRPDLALEWARSARQAWPSNPFPWTIEFNSLRRLNRIQRALALALDAVARFPENEITRNGLAEVLKAQGRLVEAEQVYRETMKRFPEYEITRNGLAEVLKAQGRLVEAEQVYRETMKRFPEREIPRNGLAEVLKAQGRLPEAEQVYRETMKRFPEDEITRNGLAEVLKAQGRLPEAERIYRETIKRFPPNEITRNGFAEVLKAQGRLPDAEQVFRETIKIFPPNEITRRGLGDVLEAQGRLDEAEVFRERISPFPEIKITGNDPAEVSNAQGRLAEAEQVYREMTAQTGDEPTPRDAGRARLQPADVEILLTDFILLRKWAPAERSIAQIRESLHTLMERVGPHFFDDVALASEEARLLLSSDRNAALDFLKEAERRFPGSAKLAYTRASAERLRIKSSPSELRSPSGQEAIGTWGRLVRVDVAMEPLQLLGLSRTLPLLRDGAELNSQTRNTFGKLAFRIDWLLKHSAEHSLDRAWAGKVSQNVFAGERIENSDQLPSLDELFSRLEENSDALDYLEAEYVDARAVV